MAKTKTNKGTGWYSVRVLLKCTGKGQPAKIPLFEDRIILLRAAGHGDARKKGRKLAQGTEAPYKNPFGDTVRWRVTHVIDSVELFEDEFDQHGPKDGMQIYWRYIRSADPVKRLEREGTMNGLFREK
ncbi:MAG: DUF4288 domain-containing protein [Terriglobales bacterium]